MKPGFLVFAACLGAAIVPLRAQSNVVLSQKFTVIPFTMQPGAKLPGDHVCKFFLLTHYGTASAPAWIGFNHKNDNVVQSESIHAKDATISIEDTEAPYATKLENDTGTTWTIHISKSDYETESNCLKELPQK